MPQFAYSAINAQGNELSGEIHAADLSSARDVLLNGGLLAERIAEIKSAAGADKKKSGMFAEEGAAEVAAGLLAPVRDDDRGRPLGRDRARDPRGADG